MISYGTDYGYANDRLSGTLVRYEGYPCFIHNINLSDGRVSASFLTTDRFKDQNLYLKYFDLSPVPLGYVNLKSAVSYVLRYAKRQYKQGLRSNTLSFKGPRVSMESPEFADSIMNRFPELETCLDYVENEEKQSIAFHRKFAIRKTSKNIMLDYRGFSCGALRKDKLSLEPKFLHLQESLEEAIYEDRIAA